MAQLRKLNVRVLLCATLMSVASVSRAEPQATVTAGDGVASGSVQPGEAMVAPVKRVAPQMPANKFNSEKVSDTPDAKIKADKPAVVSTKKKLVSKTVKKKRN